MCKNCDDLRSKLEAKLGKLTEGEFKGVKVITAMGADFDTVVDAVTARRNGEESEVPAEIKEAVKKVIKDAASREGVSMDDLVTALNNVKGSMVSAEQVEEILQRPMTDEETTMGYHMAIRGKSVQEIADAVKQKEGQVTTEVSEEDQADMPDELKQLIKTAKEAGAEVRIMKLDDNSSLADALKQALEEEESESDESSEDEEDDVEIQAIAMFDENGNPVSVDMVKYEDYLEMEELATEAVETAEMAQTAIEKLQKDVARLMQLRDLVGEFANKTFYAPNGEAVRAGHFLSKEVLHKFPDLYK